MEMEIKTRTGISGRFEEIKYRFSLSNSDLAKLAGVTGQAIGDIVNGVTDNPKVNLLTKLSKALKINLVWLASGEGAMMQSDEGNITDDSMVEFFRQQIEEKDRQLFETKRQLFEKENIIARLRGRAGKRKGVFNQATLFPMA